MHAKDFERFGARAAIVGAGGMGTPLIKAMKLPIPVLVDADRSVYRAFGLSKTLLVQQSATVVLDERGTVRYMCASYGPWDAFNYDETISALTEVAKDR